MSSKDRKRARVSGRAKARERQRDRHAFPRPRLSKDTKITGRAVEVSAKYRQHYQEGMRGDSRVKRSGACEMLAMYDESIVQGSNAGR